MTHLLSSPFVRSIAIASSSSFIFRLASLSSSSIPVVFSVMSSNVSFSSTSWECADDTMLRVISLFRYFERLTELHDYRSDERVERFTFLLRSSGRVGEGLVCWIWGHGFHVELAFELEAEIN